MRKMVIVCVLLGAVSSAQGLSLSDCSKILADKDRLACFDNLAASKTVEFVDVAVIPSIDNDDSDYEAADDGGWLQRRIAAEKRGAERTWVITPHLRNYMLPVTYTRRTNLPSWEATFPDASMDRFEAKFQLSFKALVSKDLFIDGLNLWAAYTQESWWQVYNSDESSPFRETNYQPELILSMESDWEVLGFKNTGMALSLNHQSNGRSEPLSRSWNRIIGSTAFERGNFSFIARAWYRIPEAAADDDNPEIIHYYGYGDLSAHWRKWGHLFAVTVRNNFRSDNRGAFQLDWTFPINRRFRGYVQYANGYGENLLDYDVYGNRLGVGIVLTDLL